MDKMLAFFRRLAFALRARRHAADLADELEFHRARIQADLERDGIPPAEAAVRSRRAMGNSTLAREDARDVWTVAVVDRTWRDVKYAVRGLRREPLFAASACLTLALGLTLATTVFSVVDAELWKPLPFAEPQQLVAIYPRSPGVFGAWEKIAGADLLDWRAQNDAFSALAGAGNATRGVLMRGSARSVLVKPVTANYFDVLGEPPFIGRLFAPGDEPQSTAVLSERAWRRLFDGDPSVLGRTVTIDDRPLVIVGVRSATREFAADPSDIFVGLDERSAEFHDRSRPMVNVIGRLREGVTARAAEQEMQAIAARIAGQYPEGRAGHLVYVSDLKAEFSGYNWRPLYFFLSAAGLVMLLTCVNVASLVLARALRRGREFALRGALGGGRGALLRQLLIEGAVLAAPAGALALLLTVWALRVLSLYVPPDFLVRGGQLAVDFRVGLAAFALVAATAIVFGLVPALFARRLDLNVILGQGARSTGRSPRQRRARHGLVGAQVALTMVLVFTAALFMRSFVCLTQIPIGFEPRDTVALRVPLSGSRYAADAQIRAYATTLLDRARTVAGIEAAAITSSGPLASGPLVFFIVPERPRPAPSEEPKAILRSATPDYFRTMAIPVTAGRTFSDGDVDGAVRVAVVNQTLAARLFPGENPLGRTIELIPGARAPWTRRPGRLTIVGVAANVKEVGFNEVAFNDIYVPFAQMPAPIFELVARGAVPAASIASPLRAAAASVDPRLPLSSVAPLQQRVDEALRGDRFNLLVVGIFAASALVLAGIGIFGALAYAVQEREREFGIRVALGAQRPAIVLTAIGESLRVAGGGMAVGVAAAFVIARLIGEALYLVPGDHSGLLYGVTTTDPASLSAAVVVLSLVAILASAVPARQAASTDPLIALRSE